MASMNYLNLITTDCGKQFIIDHLDQVALGIIDSEEFAHNSLFIPPTYSLYKTISEDYILEITHYNPKTHTLATTYKLLLKEEAAVYIENGNLNVLLH